MDLVKEWAGLIAVLIVIGNNIVQWFTASGGSAMKALKDHEDEQDKADKAVQHTLASHDRRIQSIENEMKHLPDREQAHKLEIAINQLSGSFHALEKHLSGRLDTLDERLKPVAATSARIQNYLMEKGAER